MTTQRNQCFCFLFAMLLLVGCSQGDRPEQAATQPATNTAFASGGKSEAQPDGDERIEYELVEVPLDDDELDGPEELLYVHCEDDEAEIIVVLRVGAPGFTEEREFRVPLRQQIVRKGLTYPRSLGGLASCGGFGNGLTSFGSLSSMTLHDATDASVDLELWFSWTTRNQNRGEFRERLPITIGETSAKHLDGDITLRWDFDKPAPPNRDDATGQALDKDIDMSL